MHTEYDTVCKAINSTIPIFQIPFYKRIAANVLKNSTEPPYNGHGKAGTLQYQK